MKKLFITMAVALALAVTFTSCDDKVVLPGELPVEIQTFLTQTFPGCTVSYATRDRELFGSTYEVLLSDGTKVDFGTDRQWDKIERVMQPVPDAVVLPPIKSYVEASFPGVAIIKIDKERFGYEVELANDLDLKFNKQGAIREIDD